MRSDDDDPNNVLEQLRARRRHLADRIQSLLAELENVEREFEDVNEELERRFGDSRP